MSQVVAEQFHRLAGRAPTDDEMRHLLQLKADLRLQDGDPTIKLLVADLVAVGRMEKATSEALRRFTDAVERARAPLAAEGAANASKLLQEKLTKDAGGILRQLAAQAAAAAPAVAASRYLSLAGIVGLMLLTAVFCLWTGYSAGSSSTLASPYFKAFVEAGNDPSALLPPADCKSAIGGGLSSQGSCWVSIRRPAGTVTISADTSSPIGLLPPLVQIAGLIALIVGFLAVGFWSFRAGGWWAAVGVFSALTCILFLASLLPPTAWAAAWKVIWS